MITIGLLGLAINNDNKGCSALSYSFLSILESIDTGDKLRIRFFTNDTEDRYESKTIHKVEFCYYNHKKISGWKNYYKSLKECDYVIDFTAGDSFSDIYGLKRFLKISLEKRLAEIAGSKLILGPQTYGPYNSKISKWLVKRILKKSFLITSRDGYSTEIISKYTGKQIYTYSDIAFKLPTISKNLCTDKMKVGINISGLLINGGYTKNNQFGLIMDYLQYCREIIKNILEMEYEVYLIPHVISGQYDSVENDYKAAVELKKEFSSVIVIDDFSTPMDIKGYISEMDFFIGSRMHATIAALSSNVATVPIAYSDKFSGLFNTLGYEYVIDGRRMPTKQAVEKTIEYLSDRDKLEQNAKIANTNAQHRLDYFANDLWELLKDEGKSIH